MVQVGVRVVANAARKAVTGPSICGHPFEACDPKSKQAYAVLTLFPGVSPTNYALPVYGQSIPPNRGS